MELTIQLRKPFDFRPIILILFSLILAISVFSRLGREANSYFNDCFNRSGVKEIYGVGGGAFIRICEMPDGSVIAQRVRQSEGGWYADYIYYGDTLKDIPELLVKIYPVGPGETLPAYVVKLISIFLP